jgi:hypothetical protein
MRSRRRSDKAGERWADDAPGKRRGAEPSQESKHQTSGDYRTDRKPLHIFLFMMQSAICVFRLNGIDSENTPAPFNR